MKVEKENVLKKELELYLHIPFCVRKCAYCDFLSAPAKETVWQAYTKQLTEEIQEFELAEDYIVTTVFVGGGTPSILPGEEIERIFEGLKKRFPYWVSKETEGKEPEITIECNPGTLTQEKLLSYKRAGINRLSIGLQSANDQELKLLGRIHSYEEFLESYRLARKAGFTNINVDLMSALPGQTLESWCETLRKICELEPEHISAYSLIIEEGTPFYEKYQEDVCLRDAGKEPQLLPSEDTERAMYQKTEEILAEYGYHRYEISNYAKEGCECRHNTGYWKRTDYVGFGLGAASLQNPLRYHNTNVLADYLEGDFAKKELFVLTKDNQIEETMFLGLRLCQGVSIAEFQETFHCRLTDVYAPQLKRLKEQGMIWEAEGRIALTELGRDVSNQVLAEFMLN